ncbi:hypothetical protein HY310_00795 [Candidatus Microgenomates bacterium]|nr:hypothetical protein [Candidatus Microgenomates bacterium]
MNRRLGQIETELHNLFEMRISGQITQIGDKTPDQVYNEYKTKKEFERKTIQESRAKLEQGNQDWKKKASDFFSDCCNAESKFLAAKEEKQYLFLRRVTSNLFLDDKQLIVTHKTPFCYLLKQADHPDWLAYWNDYRHANWQEASLYSEQVAELNAVYAN